MPFGISETENNPKLKLITVTFGGIQCLHS